MPAALSRRRVNTFFGFDRRMRLCFSPLVLGETRLRRQHLILNLSIRLLASAPASEWTRSRLDGRWP